METRVDEIAEKIYRLSTLVPGTAGPAGLTFNQFLIDADEPLLFHCGQRFLFPSISSAVGKLIPIERLRWITFSHVESDECGSMNEWLAAAPKATAAHGHLGCNIWLKDTAIREPRVCSSTSSGSSCSPRISDVDSPVAPQPYPALA